MFPVNSNSISRPEQTPSELRRKIIGLGIMATSIVAFFAWGFAFNLFGHRIRLDLATAGFGGWIAIGLFGFGFALAGVRLGLRFAVIFFGLAAVAVVGGVARGVYR